MIDCQGKVWYICSAPCSVPAVFLYRRFSVGIGGLIQTNRVLTIKRRLILGTLIAYGVAAAASVITIPAATIDLGANAPIQTVEVHKPATKQILATLDKAQVEETVRSYFEDIPIMVEVARCESEFTHIDPATGNVKRGHMNAQDLGVMQINEFYHGTTAKRMGLELQSLEDNLAYARHLYETQGTRPWKASKYCWGDTLLAMR